MQGKEGGRSLRHPKCSPFGLELAGGQAAGGSTSGKREEERKERQQKGGAVGPWAKQSGRHWQADRTAPLRPQQEDAMWGKHGCGDRATCCRTLGQEVTYPLHVSVFPPLKWG